MNLIAQYILTNPRKQQNHICVIKTGIIKPAKFIHGDILNSYLYA